MGLTQVGDPCPGPCQMAFLLSGVTVYSRLLFYIFHLDLEAAVSPGSPGSCIVGTGH